MPCTGLSCAAGTTSVRRQAGPVDPSTAGPTEGGWGPVSLGELLGRQDGVVARRQLLAAGLQSHDVVRMVRRRELARVHPGVLVAHTGPLTWDQRAWAAVLAHHPAWLTRASALPDPPQDGPVHVAIASGRSVRPVPGVLAHRTARLQQRVAPLSTLPRLRLEEAVVEVAAAAPDPYAAFAAFARLCHTRRSHPRAIAEALVRRRGVPARALLLEMLTDLADGACSVLEREYLVRVERAHRLPAPARQLRVRTAGGVVYRDADHLAYGVVVELDGRQFHDSPRARADDLDRDLDTVAADGGVTLRIGWRQVTRDACRTAVRVGRVLQRRGWSGTVARCPHCP